MSLNLEQEFPLDMFPEIICSFIQHGLMITATIHSFWTFQILLVALFFRHQTIWYLQTLAAPDIDHLQHDKELNGLNWDKAMLTQLNLVQWAKTKQNLFSSSTSPNWIQSILGWNPMSTTNLWWKTNSSRRLRAQAYSEDWEKHTPALETSFSRIPWNIVSACRQNASRSERQ